jgi:hypothetical protein
MTQGADCTGSATRKKCGTASSENRIHPNQIYKWKKPALKNFPQLFEEDRQGILVREAEHESDVNELYAEIECLSAS